MQVLQTRQWWARSGLYFMQQLQNLLCMDLLNSWTLSSSECDRNRRLPPCRPSARQLALTTDYIGSAEPHAHRTVANAHLGLLNNTRGGDDPDPEPEPEP